MKLEYYHMASSTDKDKNQWWNEEYARVAYEEYIKDARYPAELYPTYKPYWFWQKVYPVIWKIRETIWYSKIIHTMWDGYKIHELDWIKTTSPRGYSIRKQVPTRTPIFIQKTLQFIVKHFARCWGIGHFLEAIAIGDRWGWDCPNCGYSSGILEDYMFSPWYRFTTGGSRFTGEYTQHWFAGFFDCPRCLFRWDYEDSN